MSTPAANALSTLANANDELNLTSDSTAASKLLGSTTSPDGVTYTAVKGGTEGNAITVAHVAPAGGSTTVAVVGSAITVSPKTGATNADVVTAVNASAAAAALVSAAATGPADLVVAVSATNLAGGVDGPSDKRVTRWINVISNAIEGYLGRKGLLRRQTGYVEKLPAYGRERLYLSLTPVEQVTSIVFGNPVAQETLDPALYYLEDGPAGIVFNENGFTNTGLIIKAIEPYLEPGSEELLWQVTYDGGFLLPGDSGYSSPPAGQTALPAEIEQATLIGVTQISRGRGVDRNLTGERVLNAQQQWKEGRKLITEEMVDLLQNWYRPR